MFRDLIGKGVEICNIGLQQGYIKEDGSVSTSGDTDHSKYVVTGFIDGGLDFLTHLNEHYFVTHVSIFDTEGNLLLQRLYTNQPRQFHKGMEFSFHLPKQYKMRLSICHNESIVIEWNTVSGSITPDQDISPDEDIIIDFYKVDRNYFDIVQSEDPSYQQAMRRVNHISMIPLYNWKNKFVNFGVNYSDQNETPGRVGFEVSPYTYATAIRNPRSVYYTEKKSGSLTQYGWQYHSGTQYGWFGQNCSNSVDFVRGYTKALHFARNYSATTQYGNKILNAEKVIPGDHCENLKPLDTLVNTHHVWIVAEIWKDASGLPRFVRCAESGGGDNFYRTTIFSTESFLERVTTEATDPYEITRVPGVIEAAQEGWYDYVINDKLVEEPTAITYNDDICTFCGDKVDFMWGGIIYLNVQRHPGWKTVEIDKYNTNTEQYEHWKSIDIRSLSTSQTDGDWVDVKLSQYYPYDGDEYGKYRAYCTKTNDNLFDSTWPMCTSSDGTKYWYINVSTNKLVYSSSVSALYAMPCKPNTTYILYQPRSNANRLLRLAWSKHTSLSFLDGTTSQNCYDAAGLVDNPDGTTSVQITTGSDAKMLFIQLGGSQYEQARNIVQLQEVDTTPVTQNSGYTWFEVLAARFKTWAFSSTAVDNYIEPVYGEVQYITYENTSGFTNAGITDYYRFIQPTNDEMSLANGFINKRGTKNIPNSTYPYACVRVKGEYGYAKREIAPTYPTNYYSSSYYQASYTIDDNGNPKSNTDKNLITITDLVEGDVYRYGYYRRLGTGYTQEPYAFYDSNDNLIGTVGRFYPTSEIPAADTWWHADLTVPVGAVKLKIGAYKNNDCMTVYNATYEPPFNYYNPEYYTTSMALNDAGAEVSNSTRNLVRIDGVTPGEVYNYSYTRVLSTSYYYERYAFYDANGDVLNGGAARFYQTSAETPEPGTNVSWNMTVPADAVTLKVDVLFGNSNISITKV